MNEKLWSWRKTRLWNNLFRLRTRGCPLTGILVTLDRGCISLKLDNLTDELIPADLDQLVHFGAGHVLGHDDYKVRIKVGVRNHIIKELTVQSAQAPSVEKIPRSWVSTYAGQRLWRCVHTWTLPFRSCLPCCFLSCMNQRVRVSGVCLLLCLSVVNKSLSVSDEAMNVCVL